MRDPLWRIKSLPWITLIQNALLTVLLATLLDIALIFILVGLSEAGGGQLLLGGSLGQTLLRFIAAGGIGALSIILMERLFRPVVLDTAVMWALVVCLAIALYLKSLLPIPTLLVEISYLHFVGLLLGLFSRGRVYWR